MSPSRSSPTPAPIGGSFLLDGDQAEFVLEGGVPLDVCFQVDTASSNLISVATNEPILGQQVEACSAQVAVPPLAKPYLLEGETRQIALELATTVDRAAVTLGRATFDGVGEVVFDWATGALTAPAFSTLFASDGASVALGLSGTDANGPLRIANVVTLQALFIGGDADADGVPNELEEQLGLSPISDDTDGDGTLDGDEDADGDGAGNALEIASLGTDPLNPDSDDDGLSDGGEVQYGSDALLPDSDGDGLIDGAEVAGGSSPTDSGSFNVASLVTALSVEPAQADIELPDGQPDTVQLEVIATIEFDGRSL